MDFMSRMGKEQDWCFGKITDEHRRDFERSTFGKWRRLRIWSH